MVKIRGIHIVPSYHECYKLAYLSHAGNYALAIWGGMQDDYVFSNGDTSNEGLECEQMNELDDNGVRLDEH